MKASMLFRISRFGLLLLYAFLVITLVSCRGDSTNASSTSAVINDANLTKLSGNLTNANIQDIWASSPSNAFLVSDDGIILHYDGNKLEQMVSGTNADLHRVWGTNSNNVMAVGEGGTALYYDGSRWSILQTPTQESLNALWGEGSLWLAASYEGLWVLGSTGGSAGIWQSSTQSEIETLLHQHSISAVFQLDSYIYDGSKFKHVFNDGVLPSTGIVGTDLHNECSSTKYCLPYLMNESTLYLFTSDQLADGLYELWEIDITSRAIVSSRRLDYTYVVSMWSAPGSLQLYLAAYDWPDNQVYSMTNSVLRALSPPEGRYNQIFGLDSSHIFLVGENEFFSVYDGDKWTYVTASLTADDLHGAFYSPEESFYTVAKEKVYMRDSSGAWTITEVPEEGYVVNLFDIWGTSDNSLYAVGGYTERCCDFCQVFYFNGATWSDMSPRDYQYYYILPCYKIVGINDDLYVLDERASLHHYDASSSSWRIIGNSYTLDDRPWTWAQRHEVDFWAADAAHMYLVRYDAGVFFYDGRQISRHDYLGWGLNTNLNEWRKVRAVWGYGDHVFLGGHTDAGPRIVHFNGTSAELIELEIPGVQLHKIWGTSAENVYAMGSNGFLMHFDGNNWTQLSTKITKDIYDMTGYEAGHLFTVGAGGDIYEFNE
ncbi:MAG: hypothetical protein AB2807_09955 [Candidatus Sedimenticola endophacoides]